MNNFEKTLCEFIEPKVTGAGKPVDTSSWERGKTEFEYKGEWYVFAQIDRTGALQGWKKKTFQSRNLKGNKTDISIGRANIHDKSIKL